MQRKTCTLNSRRNSNRGGFAMIMAIFFMIIMATLMAYMLAATAETSKRTINNYLLAQVQLVAKSSVEYAILQVSAHDRLGGSPCLQDITIDYPASDLTATVRINYFGFGAGCAGNGTVDSVQTAESNGTMLIDVYVTSDDTLGLTEPIRFHRRTLQKL